MTSVDEIRFQTYMSSKRTTQNDDSMTRVHDETEMVPVNPEYKDPEPKPHKPIPKRLHRRTTKTSSRKKTSHKKPTKTTTKKKAPRDPGKRVKTEHSFKIRRVIQSVTQGDKATDHQTELLVQLVQVLWDIFHTVPKNSSSTPYTVENHTLVVLYGLEKGIKVANLDFIPIVPGVELVNLKNLYKIRISPSRYTLRTHHVTKAEGILRNTLRRAQTTEDPDSKFFKTLRDKQAYIHEASALLLSHC